MIQDFHSTLLDQSPFSSSAEYMQLALSWLNRLLEWQIALTKQTYGALADDEYRGLYIPDVEVEILSGGARAIPDALAISRDALARERESIAARAQAAVQAGIDLPLERIASCFGLGAFERDLLLLALAPELDLRYERLYAYIQDDVTKKRASVDLALRLLTVTPEERRRARSAFDYSAPLIYHRLVQLFEDGQRQPPLLARFIKLDDRIVAELLGQRQTVDALLAPFVTLARPACALSDLVLPDRLAERLRHAMRWAEGSVLALQGSYGSGRKAIAEALCAEAGFALLTVDLGRLPDGEPGVGTGPTLSAGEGARRILREATLQNAAILWQGVDRLLHDEPAGPWRAAILAALEEYPGPAFMVLERPWEARGALPSKRFMRIELPELSYGAREQIWRQRFNGTGPGDQTLQALASTFRLSGGQIRDAVAMARSLAGWRESTDGAGHINVQDLYIACRAQSSGRLDNLAHKINTTYRWDDIVLPPDQLSQLREICVQVRHRRTVLERWGFDRHLAMGKGVNVLFAGQSGTGKTMAAEIIAADLGLELYKVDLSSMVSKYIGETEKNLDRVFTAAREANAILFFDEADALFGKRSEVKDAHDRYANIEVGYLLQKMEEYDGVVILATNLRKNLDDAFVRRLHVAIDFPFPEEPDRLRIWSKVFPREAPLADQVNLDFLARQFKLSGGNIRNIALMAAFLAAEDGSTIDMPHIVRAIKREYQKLGKLVTVAEFGAYLGMVKG